MSKYPGRIVTDLAPAGYSVFFDGSGDDLSIATNTAFADLPGDFTIECWFYTGSTSVMALAGTSVFNSSGYFLELNYSGAGRVSFVPAPFGNRLETASSVYSTNTWNHIAYVRSGTTVTIYVNGTSVVSGTRSVTANTQPLTIGQAGNGWDARYYFNGYISNFRIVKGTALYTAAFTPPTQLFNITNTSLLTCNSPTIIDQSNNAFAITTNGNAAVSTLTPFTAYVPYNPALGASTPGVWTLDEALQAKGTRQWNMYDPYFNLTTLLLHGNGANNAQNNTFLDSGTANGGVGFTITRNPASGPNAPTQGSFSPFSQTGWGNFFNGSTDFLTLPSTSSLSFGTGDFCVEFWLYRTGTTGGIFSNSQNVGGGDTQFEIALNGSNRVILIGWNTTFMTGATTINTNIWYHIAVVRSGTSMAIFVNGTRDAATTSANNFSSTNAFLIGAQAGGSGRTIGYISNLRAVKGSSVYNPASLNITVQTTPLTNITNTSLLTCQSNRFVDNGTANSGSGFAITVSGTPSVQSFSPFYPTAAYTPATVGGSGYFDGTGDYLTVANNAAFNFGSGNFCIETWFYPTVASQTTKALITLGSVATGAGAWLLWLNTSAFPAFYVTTGGTTATRTDLADNKIPPINSWTHIVVCRTSNTLSLFVNGSRVASTAYSSTVFNDTTDALTFMVPSDGGSVTAGYLSGSRIIKGSSPYDATLTSLTVPTAPATNITNTSLLLNFTNAGIVDSTAKNALETVGNAQISTTQSRFGGSSLYSDGTGDRLIGPNSPNLNIQGGNWTLEAWVYPETTAGYRNIVTKRGGANFEWGMGVYNGNLYFFNGTLYTGGAVSTNTWSHVAAVRNGTTTTLYVNGVGTSIGNVDSGNVSTGGLVVFAEPSGTEVWQGYIDDLRITKGVARYTANFTPQTSQWQDE